MALEEEIFIFNFENGKNFKLVRSSKKTKNPKGLIGLCSSENNEFYACPAKNPKELYFFNLKKNENNPNNEDTNNSLGHIEPMHENALSLIEVSRNGNFIATASDKVQLLSFISFDAVEPWSLMWRREQSSEFGTQ